MIYEWKLPRIETRPMLYGEYLVMNKTMLPQKDIDLNTEGFLIENVDYGEPDDTKLPFQKGDWVEKDYVTKNFREVSR